MPKKSASRANVRPSYTWTRGPPPWPAATTRSGTPSPVRSPAATFSPPVKSPNGRTPNRIAPVLPSRMRTSAATPGPFATTTSGTPSPLKSAVVARTPPVNSGPNGVYACATSPAAV